MLIVFRDRNGWQDSNHVILSWRRLKADTSNGNQIEAISYRDNLRITTFQALTAPNSLVATLPSKQTIGAKSILGHLFPQSIRNATFDSSVVSRCHVRVTSRESCIQEWSGTIWNLPYRVLGAVFDAVEVSRSSSRRLETINFERFSISVPALQCLQHLVRYSPLGGTIRPVHGGSGNGFSTSDGKPFLTIDSRLSRVLA